jgi:hypothetical protein
MSCLLQFPRPAGVLGRSVHPIDVIDDLQTANPCAGESGANHASLYPRLGRKSVIREFSRSAANVDNVDAKSDQLFSMLLSRLAPRLHHCE